MNKLYLGDSVYAEWAAPLGAFATTPRIKLTTNNGWPDDPRNVIYLELEIFDALVKFVEKGPQG